MPGDHADKKIQSTSVSYEQSEAMLHFEKIKNSSVTQTHPSKMSKKQTNANNTKSFFINQIDLMNPIGGGVFGSVLPTNTKVNFDKKIRSIKETNKSTEITHKTKYNPEGRKTEETETNRITGLEINIKYDSEGKKTEQTERNYNTGLEINIEYDSNEKETARVSKNIELEKINKYKNPTEFVTKVLNGNNKTEHTKNEINNIKKVNKSKTGGARLTKPLIINNITFDRAVTMERINGATLAQYIKDNADLFRHNPSKIAELSLALIEVLKLCHAEGVIHHDIKADNIIIWIEDGKFCAKLVDFGLSVNKGSREIGGAMLFGAPELLSYSITPPPAHVNHDYYSLFTSLMYEFNCNNIPHNLLGADQKKLDAIKNPNKFYAFSVKNKNTKNSNAISQLLCPNTSKLGEHHIDQIETQLKEMANQENAHVKNVVIEKKPQSIEQVERKQKTPAKNPMEILELRHKQVQQLQFNTQIEKLNKYAEESQDPEVKNKTKHAITELKTEFESASTKEERANIIKAATQANDVCENAEKFKKAQKITPKNTVNPETKNLKKAAESLDKTAKSSGFKKELCFALLAVGGAITFGVGFVTGNPFIMGAGMVGMLAGGGGLISMGLFRCCSSNKNEDDNDLKIVVVPRI